MYDIKEAEYYVKNTMTQQDIDNIDTENNEYKQFYIKRRLSIQNHLLYPVTHEKLESMIKTQWILIQKGFTV
jgi:hypothetical protein